MSRYSPHPEYQDSGLAWLGNIPKSWGLQRLGGYFSERRTKASDKEFSALSVTMQGIVPQLETAAKTDDGDNRKLVRSGDFVINSRSDRKGSAGVSPSDGSVSLISIVLEPGDIHPPFVNHLLRSSAFQEEFYRFGKGIVADLWSTNYAAMKNIVIPVMPLEEQSQIAEFLDYETAKIDALIEKQQQLIALLKEKRQAVISHAVTKGLNPDAPRRDSGVEWLGEVPAHWTVARLKHCCEIQSGMPKSGSSSDSAALMPMLRVANVQDGWLNLDDVHLVPVERGQAARFLLRSGDVLMNEGGDRDKLGRGTIWRGEIPSCIHQNHVFAIRPLTIEPEWLDAVTRADYAKFHFFQVAKQSTNLASISSTNIKETPLVIPPAGERSAILDYIDKVVAKTDRIMELAEQQRTFLQERRTALISAAVTGKIDVRGWKPPEPTAEVELAS